MSGRRAAAASQQVGARRGQLPRAGGKACGIHVEDGLQPFEPRQAGIGLGQERHRGERLHGGDIFRHLFGTRGAVAAHGIRAQALQRNERRFRRRSAQRVPVAFKGHGSDGEDVAQLFYRQQGRTRLLNVDHGFDHDQIAAPVDQAARLFVERVHGLLKGQRAERFDEQAGGPDVAGDQRFPAAGLPGLERQFPVDRSGVFFHAELLELEAVCAERAGVNHPGAGFCVGGVNVLNHRRIFQAPDFRTDPGRHSSFLQLGARRSVQNDKLFLKETFDFLIFCHVNSCGLCFSLSPYIIFALPGGIFSMPAFISLEHQGFKAHWLKTGWRRAAMPTMAAPIRP